jgi:hypothetical protein
MRPEVRAQVRFLTTAEGGRKRPVFTPWLRCPLLLGNEYFDCCLQPTSPGPIPLGVTTEVFLQFTRPDLVLPLLRVGLTFTLREARPTGHGVVLELLHPQEPLVSSGGS